MIIMFVIIEIPLRFIKQIWGSRNIVAVEKNKNILFLEMWYIN